MIDSRGEDVATQTRLHVPSFVPVFSPLALRLIRMGVPLGPNALLTVRGRNSGLMRPNPVAVVARGTGVSAALGSGVVAGKTGTAELESTTGPAATSGDQRNHTDAWFTSFAPARRPRVVVAVMLYRAGAGGDTAAPAARQVLTTGLSRR